MKQILTVLSLLSVVSSCLGAAGFISGGGSAGSSVVITNSYNTTNTSNLNRYDVRKYGAYGDAKFVSGVFSWTNSPILTTALGTFTAADIGSTIIICYGNTNGRFFTTGISNVLSASTIILSNSVVNTVSNAYKGTYNQGFYAIYGKHDDTPAIQHCIDLATTNGGGTVYIPAGNYLLTSPPQYTNENNAQLFFPVPGWNASTTNINYNAAPTVTIEGDGEGFAWFVGPRGWYNPATNSTVLISSLIGDNWTGTNSFGSSVIDTRGFRPGNNTAQRIYAYGQPANPLRTSFKKFTLLTSYDPNCVGININGSTDLGTISEVSIYGGILYPELNPPPIGTNGYGLVFPGFYNGTYYFYDKVTVWGFYHGVEMGLMDGGGINVGACTNAFTSIFQSALVAKMRSTQVSACPVIFSTDNHGGGSPASSTSFACDFAMIQVNINPPLDGTNFWYQPASGVVLLNDPGNQFGGNNSVGCQIHLEGSIGLDSSIPLKTVGGRFVSISTASGSKIEQRFPWIFTNTVNFSNSTFTAGNSIIDGVLVSQSGLGGVRLYTAPTGSGRDGSAATIHMKDQGTGVDYGDLGFSRTYGANGVGEPGSLYFHPNALGGAVYGGTNAWSADTNGNMTVFKDIISKNGKFIGDGSGLTNIVGGSSTNGNFTNTIGRLQNYQLMDFMLFTNQWNKPMMTLHSSVAYTNMNHYFSLRAGDDTTLLDIFRDQGDNNTMIFRSAYGLKLEPNFLNISGVLTNTTTFNNRGPINNWNDTGFANHTMYNNYTEGDNVYFSGIAGDNTTEMFRFARVQSEQNVLRLRTYRSLLLQPDFSGIGGTLTNTTTFDNKGVINAYGGVVIKSGTLTIEGGGRISTTNLSTSIVTNDIAGNIATAGNVTAAQFVGDGSQLTGISGGSAMSDVVHGFFEAMQIPARTASFRVLRPVGGSYNNVAALGQVDAFTLDRSTRSINVRNISFSIVGTLAATTNIFFYVFTNSVTSVGSGILYSNAIYGPTDATLAFPTSTNWTMNVTIPSNTLWCVGFKSNTNAISNMSANWSISGL